MSGSSDSFNVSISIATTMSPREGSLASSEVSSCGEDGSVSSEAYSDIKKAREFVLNRIKNDAEAYNIALNQHYLISIVSRGTKYQIDVVNVK